MSSIALQGLLLLCLWILAYHHLVYPVLVNRLAERRRKTVRQSPPATVPDEHLPHFTVIVPAYNEEAYIADKIRNLAALDYPRERLKIVVALDGSRDRTRPAAEAAIASYGEGTHIELRAFPRNRGKVAVLNQCIAEAADSELIALTDASALMAANALRRAASQLAAPDVGVVFGTYRLRDAGSEGERVYTIYQTQLRYDEATLDSPMGGHGALYFIRRRLWRAMPPDTINDDFILPMSIVATGARAIYDRSIVAEELERTQATQEFHRRVRIGAGNLQQALRLWKLADLRRPWLAFTFLSGKGSRPFMPFIAILAIIATASLAAQGSRLYALMLMLELATLALAAAVIAFRSPATPRVLAWLGYLVEGHFASMMGAIQVLLGLRLKHWQPEHSDAPTH
ncbi:MAG: glycosyltransferase family 2 protein [Hyphomicrobiaceae bacterium]|nr:glycosyltransferase family 2 protein [Hyphomicrobiaceae bacterium]